MKKLMYLVVLGMAGILQAGTVWFHNEAPAVGSLDIFQLAEPTTSQDNVASHLNVDNAWSNDGATYIAGDRTNVGQTFTTASDYQVYYMKGFWLKHVLIQSSLNNGTWWDVDNAGAVLTFRVSSVSGTTLTALKTDSYTITGTEENNFGQGGTGTAPYGLGTGTWIYFEFNSPVALAADSLYAFDVSVTAGTLYFETAGVINSQYPGGAAYNTATKGALAIGTVWEGDRTFIVDMIDSFAYISPAKDAVNVPLTAQLSWSLINPDIEYIDLYFGTQNEPNLSTIPAYKRLSMDSSATSYVPQLENETTYYWRVDAYEPNSAPGATDYLLTVGPVWSFTTIGQAPYFTQQPARYTLAESGQTVELTVQVESFSPAFFQWFKAAGNVQNPDIDTQVGSLGFDGLLTLTGVQTEDEAYYYCQVTNQGGTVYSDMARLAIRRMVAYLPMESITDNVTPDVEGDFDMTLTNDTMPSSLPVLDAGVDELGGSSLLFGNTLAADPNHWGQYGMIEPGVADYQDITIALWVYWNGGGNWQRIIDFGNDINNYMMITPSHGSQSRFVLRSNGGSEQIIATSPLPTGEWVYVTATRGGQTGRLYVNGELRAANTAVTFNPFDFKPTLNYVGKSQYADPFFNGRIDELKIYNYARSTEQIAQDYLATRGDWVCNNELEALAFDFNDDCRVDLEDFAMFAREWIKSNRIYPAQ